MKALALWLALFACSVCGAQQATSFAVSFPAARSSAPLSGRVILLISRDLQREPRSHVQPDEPLDSPYIFGLNVLNLAPATAAVLDDTAFGWPARALSAVPPGEYFVQAVFNRYEAHHLADGRNLLLAPDKGEGQSWARKPGNLYSKPIKMSVGGGHTGRTALVLDQEIEIGHRTGRGQRGREHLAGKAPPAHGHDCRGRRDPGLSDRKSVV